MIDTGKGIAIGAGFIAIAFLAKLPAHVTWFQLSWRTLAAIYILFQLTLLLACIVRESRERVRASKYEHGIIESEPKA